LCHQAIPASSCGKRLKGFLALHRIESTIIYWNLLFDGLMPSFARNTDNTHLYLLPFFYALAEEYRDDIGKSKANALMKARLPFHDLRNDNSDYLQKTTKLLTAAIDRELGRIDEALPLLFGISCKYEQWIPGVILAKQIKQRFPAAKIVIGGISNASKAASILQLCSHFDFAVWGEGEYPLLELCQALEDNLETFSSIPRLVYRKDNALHVSPQTDDRYHDLNRLILSDHHDYFRYLNASDQRNIPVIFPLESSRGCVWNRCRFCVYSDGYKHRVKSPAVVKREIEHLTETYQARYFAFMDNDIATNAPERLEAMLDDLIRLRRQHDFQLIAEIIPKNITAATIRKLSQAGFNRLHFGYESLSERLLKTMGKKTTFSDNIFFIKFAHKYKIKLPSANIICGAIGEEDVDILECIDNLHFLRFFLKKDFFAHNMIPLRVAQQSDFYRMIESSLLVKWEENAIHALLPPKMLDRLDRFSLFDFSAPPRPLWEAFAQMNTFYYEHSYAYSFLGDTDGIFYKEFFDGELLLEYRMTDLEHSILQATNSGILHFQELQNVLCAKHKIDIEDQVIATALNRLKEKHLIYFAANHRSIISIIDTDQSDDSLPCDGRAK